MTVGGKVTCVLHSPMCQCIKLELTNTFASSLISPNKPLDAWFTPRSHLLLKKRRCRLAHLKKIPRWHVSRGCIYFWRFPFPLQLQTWKIKKFIYCAGSLLPSVQPNQVLHHRDFFPTENRINENYVNNIRTYTCNICNQTLYNMLWCYFKCFPCFKPWTPEYPYTSHCKESRWSEISKPVITYKDINLH